jgi:hypothetical protein
MRRYCCTAGCRYAEAERRFREAVDEARLGFPPGDPHIPSALHYLAELYRNTRHYDEAQPLYEEVCGLEGWGLWLHTGWQGSELAGLHLPNEVQPLYEKVGGRVLVVGGGWGLGPGGVAGFRGVGGALPCCARLHAEGGGLAGAQWVLCTHVSMHLATAATALLTPRC